MRIYIGADHAGYDLKEFLRPLLAEWGNEVVDKGTHVRDLADDYPDFMRPVAEAVVAQPGSMGIVIGGSGQGEAMVCNRVPGARAAALYHFTPEVVKLSREHNDANILSLGARFLSDDDAREAVRLWLATPFSGDQRHKRRLAKF